MEQSLITGNGEAILPRLHHMGISNLVCGMHSLGNTEGRKRKIWGNLISLVAFCIGLGGVG